MHFIKISALILASLSAFSAHASSSSDAFRRVTKRTYTCAYVVKQPGLNILYFAATSPYQSSARFEAEQTCRYNKGRPFGLEVCSKISCSAR